MAKNTGSVDPTDQDRQLRRTRVLRPVSDLPLEFYMLRRAGKAPTTIPAPAAALLPECHPRPTTGNNPELSDVALGQLLLTAEIGRDAAVYIREPARYTALTVGVAEQEALAIRNTGPFLR